MENSEILKQVNEIFIDVLDNKDIVLVRETTANDVEEWDSLTHIQLVVALEKYFKIRFTSQEIRNWATVGEMVESISSKLKSA
jgi:acyl carrier protein